MTGSGDLQGGAGQKNKNAGQDQRHVGRFFVGRGLGHFGHLAEYFLEREESYNALHPERITGN
jgi:hypothetical protein